MPELPEVEVVKNALEPILINQCIERVTFHRPDLRFPLPPALPGFLKGQVVDTILRRGKYIVVFARNGYGFVLHLGMSGVIRVEGPGTQKIHEKHDHVEFQIRGGTRVVFNDARRFGFLEMLEKTSWETYPAFAAMGPEPLGNDFNGPVLMAALKGLRSPVKTALLNQKVVAGIGNIYACEALYMAGLDPRRPAGSLNASECEALVASIRHVLEAALESGGSSLRDYKHIDGKPGYFQHHFAVYDHQGESCPRCKCDITKTGGIQRIVQAGRSTFLCETLQG